jgi:hypothetical protein
MTPLTKVGKRLDNITRYILDNNPQDKWVLSNIVPMFLEAIKSSTTIQEEQIIISQLNKLLDNFEFRYNQIFEGKNKIAHQINQNLQELIEKIKKDFNIQEEKSKRDRCLRIADRKFDKPSAYKSGAVVRCRKGDIWKGIKEIERSTSLIGGNIDYNQFVDWAKGEADKITNKKESFANLEFQWAENPGGVKVIVYEKNIPLGYIGLEKFEDGYKINTLGVKDAARGKGLATKMYDYIISKTKLYSDKIQTPEARKLWIKLASKHNVKGYDKSTKKIFDIKPENDELKSLDPNFELYSDKKNNTYLVIQETDDPQSGKAAPYRSGNIERCRQGDIWKGIKEEQLDESKQVGTIYHYTTFEAGLKILQSNQLKSGEAADSTRQTPVFAISFTRDKRFHDNHVVGFDESSFGNTPQLRFTVDGNKLSNRFSVQPYSQGGAFSKGRKSFEAEERVISDKPFIYHYLIT